MGRSYISFILLISILSFFLFSGSQNTLADQSAVLRPVADGGEDSANWANTGDTACSGASCYLEVDESSGASCTNSDGDTSYVDSGTNNAKQTFDINESGVPDNSTITQISITVCYKDISPLLTSTFKTRRCVDGACTSAGPNTTTGSSYIETTYDHSDLNITKTSTTDIEIGIHVATAAVGGGPRISQISAVITYTLPGEPTPTPASGSGGSSNFAKVIFSGEAFPGAILGAYLVLENIEPFLFTSEFAVDRDGSFVQEISIPEAGQKTFIIIARDSQGNLIRSKTFTLDLKNGVTIRRDNIILAPSVVIKDSTLLKGEPLLVSGLAAPGNEVELFVDSAKVTGVELKTIDDYGNGAYEFSVDTGKLTLGSHKTQVRQIDPVKNVASDLSETRIVKVSSSASIDFNGDEKVSIEDWSIFLSNWSSQDQAVRKKDDLNNDGKVDITDFSLFLASFQLLAS